jgi:hypothetical protein
VDADGHAPEQGNPNGWLNLWQKFVNGFSGNGFKTDAQLSPQATQFTVTLNSRTANMPGGGALRAVGADHQWITTSDGKAAGMGSAKNGGQIPDAKGNSSPDKPLDPTQVVDEHGDTPTSAKTFTMSIEGRSIAISK